MSRLREHPEMIEPDADLSATPDGDLFGYVIFTQLKKDGPFIYAGWLDAPDDEMALVFAKEHYGQDQKCEHIWAAPRDRVGGLLENTEAAAEEVVDPRDYQIFSQQNAGDQYESSIVVRATCAADAIAIARNTIEDAAKIHNIWAIPTAAIVSTDDDDLIWRYTDQTYRLARGYSKAVRQKWEAIRKDRDISEYEKDDLKETF